MDTENWPLKRRVNCPLTGGSLGYKFFFMQMNMRSILYWNCGKRYEGMIDQPAELYILKIKIKNKHLLN